MHVFAIDIGEIVELGTQVATSGAIKLLEAMPDDTFEYLVGVAIVVHQAIS